MSSIDEKLCVYGQKRDINALQQIIATVDEDELINLVMDKLNTANFIGMWSYILQGFTDAPNLTEKDLKWYMLC
ncbi:hypothetical protein NQ318_014667 [Aromia moschata]|uniref:Uncharacterized protein n=1 Tax=Aromia moschata TaxID=1265417 RepID=A0AAV8ZBA7_9CUCU|nr:hypothetical protein NQ318_014667 [Aromia moschata]